jgi:hypothetical protein
MLSAQRHRPEARPGRWSAIFRRQPYDGKELLVAIRAAMAGPLRVECTNVRTDPAAAGGA